MNDLLLSIVSLVIGIVASVWVSAYYFRKSLRKSLTPYIQYYASPFSGMDPDVKKALQVTYHGIPVEDLFEIQFLIANTGDKAIRDVIEPLALTVPDGCTLLDASIIHRDPNELRVELVVPEDKRKLTVDFPLLNSQDFFILKLLLNGSPKTEELNFSIVVDELPPVLKPERLGYGDIVSTKKKEFEFSLLGIGLVLAVCGIAGFKVIYDSWHSVPGVEGGFLLFFTNLGLSGLAVILTTIPAFLFTLIGVMMFAGSFSDGRFPPSKKKFIVPENIRKSHFRFVVNDRDF